MSGFEVDAPQLRSLGTALVTHAADLTGAVADESPRLSPGAGSDWDTVRQAVSAAQGWEQFLNGLAGRLDAAGRSVVASADSYQAADELVASRLKSL